MMAHAYGRVLNKLGVDSRTAAAAWAIRRGLV
jgi:DNA-binding NarL/FixJ family response regulator